MRAAMLDVGGRHGSNADMPDAAKISPNKALKRNKRPGPVTAEYLINLN